MKFLSSKDKVILEGCNGEWAQECYLPLLTKKAAKEEIELWAVDIQHGLKLSNPEIEKDWRVAKSKNKTCYLNKSTDRQSYRELSDADYVFIVTPDKYHRKVAESWLGRLAPEGKIFIEKPLDACVESACKLKERIEKENRIANVFAFDHYLARAYPFLRHSAKYLKQVGGAEIRFHSLEPSKIRENREKTLDKGMIFDLFSHVLALVCSTVEQNSTCSATKLQTVRLKEVKAAQYAGCPISGETFAWIRFMVNHDIQVISAVGKCVGTTEDKHMTLYRTKLKIELNLKPKESKFSIFNSQGKQTDGGDLDPEPVGSFLKGILQGQEPLLTPGVLSFDTALEILKRLDEAKKQFQVDKIAKYQCNDSIERILERIKEYDPS